MDPESQSLASTGGPNSADPQGTLERLLAKHAEITHADFAKARFAEEREWYESALFYQRRQWLKWNDASKRWSIVKKDPNKPKPMPVSNYFAKTINNAANQLGAKLPRMIATACDESDKNRRAARMAEQSIPAIDKESGMRIMNPLLAKHCALWGMGVTKDYYDQSMGTGMRSVPQLETVPVQMVSCYDCQQSYEIPPLPDPNQTFPIAPQAANIPCPECGSQTTVPYEDQKPVVTEVKQFARGRLVTEVRPIFEVFLPRDCQDANLAGVVIHKYRKPKSVARRIWGERADDLKADDKSDIHEIYMEALRSLVNYNYMHDQKQEVVSIIELWSDWDQLDEKLQEALTEQFGQGAPELEEAQNFGIYVIASGDIVLDWGINPLEGKKPFTFFKWEMDPANVYPKGLAADLIPLQKRLNRLDSLVELAVMTNAVGKWLWPRTQQGDKPSGSPNEVIEWDPIGDGKVKPEFVLPHPFSPMVFQLRAQIIEDFQELGYSQGVQTGSAPEGAGGKTFRGIAYLGAKANEQFTTQRYLWETAHQLRYEKCLTWARKYWTEERKVKVAGFNGKSAMQSLSNQDMIGDYQLDFVADSSRPALLSEKFEMVEMLIQAQLLNVMDQSTREQVLDMTNLNEFDLADYLQYEKAGRDLEKLKQGVCRRRTRS
jgi:hypothetical protein